MFFTSNGKGLMIVVFGVIMAMCASGGVAEVPRTAEMNRWSASALAQGARSVETPSVGIRVLRQDYNTLNFGQSCMETPITIGTRAFQHGLGTHANSEIEVAIPEGAARFEAFVGIDNNHDTKGVNGSALFSAELDGKEMFRSDTLRGGGEPAPVSVDIPKGAKTLLLKVDATSDGPACDQADWADARFAMGDGSSRWLDEGQSRLLFLDEAVPFSFTYGDISSREFLDKWKREARTEDQRDRYLDRVSWTDPDTKLCVTVTAVTYKDFPAVDWVLTFENQGKEDSPILADIQALDIMTRTGLSTKPALLHRLEGDACGESTFQPRTEQIERGKAFRMAPTGGRPSSISAFPFFTYQYGAQGLIAAVGWTGQWAAQFDRMETGPTRVRAGMEHTHLRLHPGECIRTPRIVLFAWEKDRTAAHNAFRQMMLKHYVPKLDGKPAPVPVCLQTFDRYNARPGWATEAGQLKAAETAHALGCDTYWLDAAWFPGNFPNGVGNWFAKPAEFPNGLKPVGDLCDRLGMRFVLWFEPERVAPNTQIATEHAEFVFGGTKGGLFKLNDPKARRWLTELLSKRITEYGIDVYRNDFNIDPLNFWRDNDATESPAGDRQGITEIRYVEGLYEMWDELLARHKGLMIDNCASGGRRIDIEMCSRSIPLWRSDTNCWAGNADWTQAQTATLLQYVPLCAATAWTPDAYDVRSSSTSGLLCQFDYLSENFPFEKAKTFVAEAKENAPYWSGDFYPLTPATISQDEMAIYQFHRPDLDAGIVAAFRRAQCPLRGVIVELQGIDQTKRYSVELIDEAGQRTTRNMPAVELANDLMLRMPEPKSSLMVRYKKQD